MAISQHMHDAELMTPAPLSYQNRGYWQVKKVWMYHSKSGLLAWSAEAIRSWPAAPVLP